MSDGWRDAHRVLAVRLDSMGDVLMTGPALRALRAAVPGRQITLLTSPAGAAAAALLPDVDEVIVHQPAWIKATQNHTDPAAEAELIERLRAAAFDAAVVFNVATQSPLPAVMLAYLAGIRLRAAYAREKVYGLLTDWLADPDAAPGATLRHEVRRQLDLAASLGGEADDERLRVAIPALAIALAGERLREAGIEPMDRPWAMLHPGASAPSRRYPPERYAAAASSLVREHGWRVVLVAGADEQPLLDEIQRRMAAPAVRLRPPESLAELAGLLSLAPLVIANNSGPAHLAAAAGTPIVSLYALTNPQHTPWGVPSRVLSFDVPCRNCLRSECPMGHHLCLRGVPPGAVVAAALELADGRPNRRLEMLPEVAVGP